MKYVHTTTGVYAGRFTDGVSLSMRVSPRRPAQSIVKVTPAVEAAETTIPQNQEEILLEAAPAEILIDQVVEDTPSLAPSMASSAIAMPMSTVKSTIRSTPTSSYVGGLLLGSRWNTADVIFYGIAALLFVFGLFMIGNYILDATKLYTGGSFRI